MNNLEALWSRLVNKQNWCLRSLSHANKHPLHMPGIWEMCRTHLLQEKKDKRVQNIDIITQIKKIHIAVSNFNFWCVCCYRSPAVWLQGFLTLISSKNPFITHFKLNSTVRSTDQHWHWLLSLLDLWDIYLKTDNMSQCWSELQCFPKVALMVSEPPTLLILMCYRHRSKIIGPQIRTIRNVVWSSPWPLCFTLMNRE